VSWPALRSAAHRLGWGVHRPPAVSVIIPTYNWSAALRCAISSVLRQTVQDFELLVVGDGCTDDSASVVAAFKDRRISWHNLERNHGSQWAANNFGLKQARAEWVAYLGHDDIWYPTHLQAILRTARETEAAVITSVMILYGPPGSAIRATAGVFRDGVCREDDFVPPSGLAHRTQLTEVIGFWKEAEKNVLPIDCAYLRAAVTAGANLASTRELTVFKFNAAWRRDAYKVKSTTEQEKILALIETGIDFRQGELLDVLEARLADKLIDLKVPDMSGVGAGELHRAYRRYKGVEDRFARADLHRLVSPERFFLSDVDGGFEWHLEEMDPHFGPFRWSGPALRSSVDLPVLVDGDVSIRIHIIHLLEPDSVEHLKIFANGRILECGVEKSEAGTWVLHALARGDELGPSDNGLRVTLEVQKVQRSIDLGHNTDRRWLGVAVNWIALHPVIEARQSVQLPS
jgi:glycosyltransferase involved in cell wall biosynthesis